MTELHLSVNILNRDNILKYQHITKEKKGRERNEKHKNNNFAGLICPGTCASKFKLNSSPFW